MFLRVDSESPEPWLVVKVADILRRGGVAVLPTDTLYALACSLQRPEAIERLYALRDHDAKKPLSILLPSADEVGRWTRGLATPSYRLMKRVLPGPYTFILPASPELPRIMLRQRKTLGVRVPDNAIVRAVLESLGHPLLVTSVKDREGEFVNEPLALEEMLGGVVDVVVDGGTLSPVPSTIVDLTGDEPVLVRAGKGDVAALGIE